MVDEKKLTSPCENAAARTYNEKECKGNVNLSTNQISAKSLPDADGCFMDSLYRQVLLSKGFGSGYQIKKIVLDAGHGGKDPGCSGAHSKEKHNALAIVLKLGAYITDNYPNIKVVYTRETDVFIPLKERADIANREKADLFVSVHCNAVGAPQIHGTETYVMGLHTAQSNLEVAKRENEAIYLEDNYQKTYDGYDPNSPEAHIFGAVWQSAYLEQSILFASYVQKHTNTLAGRDDKGVKQAGFLVLRATAMPSVLIETGYLTNRTEESFLASEEGRELMASAIFEAFQSYKNQMEGNSVVMDSNPKLAQHGSGIAKKTSNSVQTAKKNPKTSRPPQTKENGGSQERDVEGIYTLRILLVSSTKPIDLNGEMFSTVPNLIEEKKEGQKYKYFVGTFASEEEAASTLTELVNLGFTDASIVKTY